VKSIRREQNQESTRKEIKSFAWHQIETSGVSSVSLGAIARSMNLTTPALYRYFLKRDDLILALTRDAHLSFCNALEKARDSVPSEDHAGRFRNLCLAFYQWAVDNPPQYQIIFGVHTSSNILDEAIGEIADQSFMVVLELIDQAYEAGKIIPEQEILISDELRNRLERLSHQGISFRAEVMYLALVSWSFINSITSLELSQRYSLILDNQTLEFFQLEVTRFMRSIGFS